jgi:hypothetical protein
LREARRTEHLALLPQGARHRLEAAGRAKSGANQPRLLAQLACGDRARVDVRLIVAAGRELLSATSHGVAVLLNQVPLKLEAPEARRRTHRCTCTTAPVLLSTWAAPTPWTLVGGLLQVPSRPAKLSSFSPGAVRATSTDSGVVDIDVRLTPYRP